MYISIKLLLRAQSPWPNIRSFLTKNNSKFSVLCNNPKKYAVVEPEGRIASQKCTDIVVRHVAVSPSATQQTDKFRIHIFDETSPGELVGKRDILATLHPGVYPTGNNKSFKFPLEFS